jgi:hypothetical protein
MNMSYWIAGKTHNDKYAAILVTGTNTAKLFHLDKANSPPEAGVLLGYRTRIPLEELSGTREEAIGRACEALLAESEKLKRQVAEIDKHFWGLKSLLS